MLLRGVFSGNLRLTGMCEDLYGRGEWLWTFLEVEGGEPTSHAAERALRPAVIWRKRSFGTQSPAGSRFVATMLTIMTTCRQENRPAWACLTDAVAVPHHGQPPPSRIPHV